MLKLISRLLFIFACCGTFALAQSPATANLRETIEQIAHAAQGRVGAMVMRLESNESVALQGDQHFPMQSVYKLPIAMAVLEQVDRGVLKLDQTIRVRQSDFVSAHQHSPIRDDHPHGVELSLSELLRFNVSESDGTACDVLLRVVGGAPVVTRYLRRLGIRGIQVATTEKAMGRNERVQYRNWARPDAMVVLLRALHEGRGLSAASRALLLQWMTETTIGPHRLKGRLPAGTIVAHKTGTSNTVAGLTRATNDVGIITLPNGQHLAVAVFVSDSRAEDAVREDVIAKIAEAAWEFWSRPSKAGGNHR